MEAGMLWDYEWQEYTQGRGYPVVLSNIFMVIEFFISAAGVRIWPMDGTITLSSPASDSSSIEWLLYMIPYLWNDYTEGGEL